MQFQDPLPVICDNCGFNKEYSLNCLRALDVNCSKCNFSLKEVGQSINAAYKETNDFFSLFEIILKVEEDFAIKIADSEAEIFLTVEDLVECIRQKTSIATADIVLKAECTFKKVGIDLVYSRDSQLLLCELLEKSMP